VIIKQYSITAAEAEAVRAGSALPPGIDRATWETGRVAVTTRPCLAGDAVANQRGELIINAEVKNANPDMVDVLLAKVPAGMWEIRNGTELWVEASAVPIIKKGAP
jgi:hypothetical protein